MLLQNLGTHFADDQQAAVAQLFFRKANEVGRQARIVHDSILKHEALSGDLQFERKKME
jgi:two-component system chemotaxis response regulator CheB